METPSCEKTCNGIHRYDPLCEFYRSPAEGWERAISYDGFGQVHCVHEYPAPNPPEVTELGIEEDAISRMRTFIDNAFKRPVAELIVNP